MPLQQDVVPARGCSIEGDAYPDLPVVPRDRFPPYVMFGWSEEVISCWLSHETVQTPRVRNFWAHFAGRSNPNSNTRT